jgi:hypothetical protein
MTHDTKMIGIGFAFANECYRKFKKARLFSTNTEDTEMILAHADIVMADWPDNLTNLKTPHVTVSSLTSKEEIVSAVPVSEEEIAFVVPEGEEENPVLEGPQVMYRNTSIVAKRQALDGIFCSNSACSSREL